MSQPEIRSVSAVSVGDIWTAIITGVRHVHSLIIEAWGANGGITRILPQGRDEVRVELRFVAPGRTNLSLTLRDERLGAAQAFETSIDVIPPGARPAYAMEQSWRGPMGMRLEARADAPQFQAAAGNAPRLATGKGAYGGMSGPFEVNLGEVIAVSYSVPATAKSVSYSASNADLNFVGPMPVYDSLSEMSARALAEGPASIHGVARDESGMVVHEASHVVQVRRKQERPHSSRAYGGIFGPVVAKLGEVIDVMYRTPEDVVSVQFTTCGNAEADSSGPLPVSNQFSQTKVRAITKGMATVYANAFNKIGENVGGAIHQFQIEDDKQERTRASSRYGGTSGPSEAVVGETVNVSFNVDPAVASVRFLAENADVLFAGPTTASGGTVQTSARVLTPGEAKIIAEAYDMAGKLVEAKHHAVMVVMNNIRGGGSSARDRNVGFGNIIGPAMAALNEKIFVKFALPERGLTVKFYASNAVVDFVGPMPVEEISAETGVQMTQEGTATIWGEAFDKLGNLAASASHAVQVLAPKSNDAPVDRSLNDLASDMQKSLEASIRARLNRD